MGRDDPPLSRERSEWCNGGYAVVERSRDSTEPTTIPPH